MLVRLEHVWASAHEIDLYNHLEKQVVRKEKPKPEPLPHVCDTFSYGEVIEPWLDEYIQNLMGKELDPAPVEEQAQKEVHHPNASMIDLWIDAYIERVTDQKPVKLANNSTTLT